MCLIVMNAPRRLHDLSRDGGLVMAAYDVCSFAFSLLSIPIVLACYLEALCIGSGAERWRRSPNLGPAIRPSRLLALLPE